jgi:hypothetical protein
MSVSWSHSAVFCELFTAIGDRTVYRFASLDILHIIKSRELADNAAGQTALPGGCAAALATPDVPRAGLIVAARRRLHALGAPRVPASGHGPPHAGDAAWPHPAACVEARASGDIPSCLFETRRRPWPGTSTTSLTRTVGPASRGAGQWQWAPRATVGSGVNRNHPCRYKFCNGRREGARGDEQCNSNFTTRTSLPRYWHSWLHCIPKPVEFWMAHSKRSLNFPRD